LPPESPGAGRRGGFSLDGEVKGVHIHLCLLFSSNYKYSCSNYYLDNLNYEYYMK
jgi:hypothetical protein